MQGRERVKERALHKEGDKEEDEEELPKVS